MRRDPLSEVVDVALMDVNVLEGVAPDLEIRAPPFELPQPTLFKTPYRPCIFGCKTLRISG